MTQRLNGILLIDDSEADIFLMSRTIKKAAITEHLITTYEAQEALDYLSNLKNYETSTVDLIFLDINMPSMTGWEFLEDYNRLPEAVKSKMVLCMITTSTAIEDKEKAAKYELIKQFINKPLTPKKLTAIIEEHFPKIHLQPSPKTGKN